MVNAEMLVSKFPNIFIAHVFNVNNVDLIYLVLFTFQQNSGWVFYQRVNRCHGKKPRSIRSMFDNMGSR